MDIVKDYKIKVEKAERQAFTEMTNNLHACRA